MGKRTLLRLAYISIFLALLLASFLCIRPVYRALGERISQKAETLRAELANATGLTLSYSSLSPSILTFLSMKGIVLADAENGKPLISIRRLNFRYNLIKLLQGKTDEALDALTVSGIEIDYDDSTDRKIVEKIINLFQRGRDNGSGDESASARDLQSGGRTDKSDWRGVSVEIPFDIIIKTAMIRFRINETLAELSLRSMNARYNGGAELLALNADCNANVHFSEKAIISTRCILNGAVRRNLEGSSLVVRLSNTSAGDLSFGNINFLLSYENSVASFRTMQMNLPLMLGASYNFDEKKVEARIVTERLSPSSFISSRKYTSQLRRLRNTNATLDVSCSYEIESKRFSYGGNGNIYVSETLVPGSLALRFTLSGDEKSVSIPSLVFSGANCDADASLAYEFARYRLSGSANLQRLELANGGVVSSELYFDSLDTGFVCFAPQLFLGEKAFTALQLEILPQRDSIDFSVEVSDYAHPDAESPGRIQVDGSYLLGTNYIQASVTTNNFFLDSAAETAAFFLNENDAAIVCSIAPRLAPYMFTSELYASSDLQSILYNAPYVFVANTQEDNQFLLISFDGNESTVQLSSFDLIYGAQSLHAAATFERVPDLQSAIFTLDLNYGSVPYHFAGSVMPNFVSLSGDYGIVAQAQRFTDGSVQGSFSVDRFPISAAGTIFTLSADTGFAYTERDGFALRIARFEAEDAGGKFAFAPRLAFAGSVTKYGAVFDSVSYSDRFSALDGSAQFLINMTDDVFGSSRFEASLNNPLSDEFVNLFADFTNPDALPLSVEMLKNNLYFDVQISLNAVDLNRFVAEQGQNNVVTAEITATGTYENPYVAVSVDSASMMIAGTRLNASGNASLEERTVRVNDAALSFGSLNVNDVVADFSLLDFAGSAGATLNVATRHRSMSMPLFLTVKNSVRGEDERLPSSFAVSLSTPGWSGDLLSNPFPFSFDFLRTSDGIFISSSENLGVTGIIGNDGALNVSIAEDKPVHCIATGKIENRALDINLSNVSIDIAELMSHFENDYVEVYRGVATGQAHIGGLISDPEFTGNLSVAAPDFSVPPAIPSHITRDSFDVVLDHNTLSVPEVTMTEGGRPLIVGLVVYFDRWTFDRMELTLRTPQNQTAPADVDIDIAEFVGMASVDLKVIVYRERILEVTGTVYAEDARAIFTMQNLLSAIDESNRIFDARVDLDISVGPRALFIVEPLLRCVFVPGSSIKLQMDQTTGAFTVTGDVRIRSGDITYFNKTFYIREGGMRFNDTDERFNPRITVRAETRERDAEGREVRLILSANNQPLFDFVPQFSSIPAKSETELQAMLGQLTVGGTNSLDPVVAGADLAVQTLMIRQLENRLRDVLNLDILSIRPTVLQNMLRYSFASSSRRSEMNVGNFFDNSTVYIGKYFGSYIYVDALLHMAYDETRIDDRSTVQGLSFTPEIGIEFESPFANIRWSTAPDISAMINNVIMPSTSITLSWRFSF